MTRRSWGVDPLPPSTAEEAQVGGAKVRGLDFMPLRCLFGTALPRCYYILDVIY